MKFAVVAGILATISFVRAEGPDYCGREPKLLKEGQSCYHDKSIGGVKAESNPSRTAEGCQQVCLAKGASFFSVGNHWTTNGRCYCYDQNSNCPNEMYDYDTFNTYEIGGPLVGEPELLKEGQSCYHDKSIGGVKAESNPSRTAEGCQQVCLAKGASFFSVGNHWTTNGRCYCYDENSNCPKDMYDYDTFNTYAIGKPVANKPTLIQGKRFCKNGEPFQAKDADTPEECNKNCAAGGAEYFASTSDSASPGDKRCYCFKKDNCEDNMYPQNSFDLYKACSPYPLPIKSKNPNEGNPKTASGSGDPHFKTWNGNKFDYHGECDLVLVDNPSFNNGQGLRIHIRTTRVQYYSYIEKIAVKIGDDVLEFANDAENFLLNGSAAEPNKKHHKTLLGGFIVRRDPKALSIRLTDASDGSFHNSKTPKIDLKVRKNGFPAVVVDAGGSDGIFKDSLGLLGDWPAGNKIGRDGATIFEVDPSNAENFALEWQVRDMEPMLFQDARSPQFPTKCTPPKKIMGARLGKSHMEEEAQKVCANFEGDQSDCIFDVIATRSTAAASQE